MASFPEIPRAGSWSKAPSLDDAQPTSEAPRVGLEQPSFASSFGEEWGSSSASGDSEFATVKVPEWILYCALGAAALGIVLSAVFESVVVAGLSWVLAAPVGMGAATVFIARNAKLQTNPFYPHSARPLILYRVSVVACFLAVIAASIRIALFVGRM